MGDFRDPAVVENWHATQLSHPARGEQLDVLLSRLGQEAPRRVLDVGVGSGLVAERVLDALPDATLVGVDFSPAMLERGTARLARFGDRARLVLVDLSAAAQSTESYDVAISVQTLHNIEPDGQRRSLQWIAGALAPGGVFLLLDKIRVSGAGYDHENAVPLETMLEWLDDSGLQPDVLDLRDNYALIAARA